MNVDLQGYELAESGEQDRCQRLRFHQEQVRLGQERLARLKEEETGELTA